MDVPLLPLVQGAGVLALAVVGFALLFSWPAMLPALRRAKSESFRFGASAALGAALIAAAGVVYAAPSLLLRSDPSPLIAIPLVATWLIVGAALALRGLLAEGAARAMSYYFALVSVVGAGAGVLTGVLAQHAAAATIAPTGAFLLGVGAVVAVVLWACADEPSGRAVRSRAV